VQPDRGEIKRIKAQGKRLGIRKVVTMENGQHRLVRQANGDCIFLSENAQCRIYAHRPEMCAQWPIRATLTETGVRLSLDPGCTNNINREWPTEVPATAQRRVFVVEQQHEEALVLHVLRDCVPAVALDVLGLGYLDLTRGALAAWGTPPDLPPMLTAAIIKMAGFLAEAPVWSDARVHAFAQQIIHAAVGARDYGHLPTARHFAVGLLIGASLATCDAPTPVAWGIRFAAWARWMQTRDYLLFWATVAG